MDRPSCSAALKRDGTVAVLTMSRASRSNAIDAGMWKDLRACISFIARASPRAVVVCGRGKNFCAGIDVSDPKTMFSTLGDVEASCEGRRREALARHIRSLQDVFTALETEIEAPVIACVRGACYGAGVDLITACTIRLCGRDARFCVKEVDVGITADVGTLQRLPSIVGFGSANELALTARVIDAEEAKRIGLVSEVCEDVEARAMALAMMLASKSPLAVRGTKRVLLRARDEPDVARGLNYVATHNAAMLMSDDLNESLKARFEKRAPVYSKL